MKITIFQLFLKTRLATSYWDNQLRENGVYEKRFARPYAEWPRTEKET